MDEIIDIIKKLIENGFAYEKDGNVFFKVKKYEDYGKLSNQKIDELETGIRVSITEDKDDPLDFALWKKKKDGEIYWDSPWGQGRPGWHIECSAMSKKYLGDTFDIHGGGQDLIFPHHENEIAQSRCAYHGEFARYWIHNGFVQVDGDKMSKSLGNFFLLREVLEKFSGNVVRLFILSTHYRKPINFSFENMEDTKKTLQNVVNSINKFEETIGKFSGSEKKGEISSETEKFIQSVNDFDEKFVSAMDEDMNTPQALSTIFNQIRETNKFVNEVFENSEVTFEDVEALKKSYDSLKIKLQNVFGIDLVIEKKSDNSSELTNNLIELLLKLRSDARKERNFKLSDEIRDEMKKLGVAIKDNKDGSTSFEIE